MNPDVEDEVRIDLSTMPYERYSMDDIKMAWHSYAYEAKQQGKETLHSALKRRDPKLKSEDHFVLEVDNQVQIDYIGPLLSDFLGFVRKKVKNYGIVISLELSAHTDEDVTVLTGKDKFAKMARKNPSLHTFKNVFNLDIEY